MDISDLPLNDLLALAADRGGATANSVKDWIKAAGYYPGNTRVSASELYAKYQEWCRNPEINLLPVHHNKFGKLLAAEFRRGRTSGRYFYYISRERDPEIGPVCEPGGLGYGGRGRPGG